MRTLERLTYVHDGDPGVVGGLVNETRGTLRFGEGSGLFEIGDGTPEHPMRALDGREVRIVSMTRSQLQSPNDDAIGEGVPCILGHSGPEVVVLVAPRSIARITGGMNDLRGKIKFGLAKVGWSL